MALNLAIEILGRPIRLAVIGGGPGSFIRRMHRTAARIDGLFDIVAGILSSKPEMSIKAGKQMKPREMIRTRIAAGSSIPTSADHRWFLEILEPMPTSYSGSSRGWKSNS